MILDEWVNTVKRLDEEGTLDPVEEGEFRIMEEFHFNTMEEFNNEYAG